jgi:CubicO group peptidase (beta-lactamase class C family)
VGAWVAEGRIPGAVLYVSRGEDVLVARSHGAARAYVFGNGDGQYSPDGGTATGGLRALDPPVPMTPGPTFDLASVTKVMATTMALMLLVDRGAVELDAPVRRYLPGFVGGGRERVTVEQLLTHRSGLTPWQPIYYRAANADEAWRRIREIPLEGEPGEARRYSDLGFMTLGLLVERVDGRRLDAFLADELYGPLGLEVTGFRPSGATSHPVATAGGGHAATSHGNPYERRMVHDSDFGYDVPLDPDSWDAWRHRTLVGEVNDGNAWHAFGGVAGHAGLFSNARELDALLRILLGGGLAHGRRWVSAAVVERFLASTGDGQALGWQLPPYAPATAFAHTGFTGTFVLGDRATGLAVVLLTNRQNLGVDEGSAYPDVGALQRAVTAALTGR